MTSATDSGGSESTTQGTGEPTTGEPTTGDEPTTTGEPTTGDEPTTTGEPTTGGVEPGVTRIVYFPFTEVNGQPSASAMRFLEVVDGVASPPTTIVDPPGEALVTVDMASARRWSAVYAAAADPAQLWVIDMVTLTSQEVALPPEVERVFSTRLSRDDAYLIVYAGPKDNPEPKDVHWYVCEIGGGGDCALSRIEPATGPTTYVSGVHEVSSATGRIWYSTRELGGTAASVLQGEVAAPEAATTLISFPDGATGLQRVSLDEATLYFATANGDAHQAMDISDDMPGPLVELHPPLAGTVRFTWAADEKAALIWSGDGVFGDLHRVAIDGAVAGPMQPFNSGAPGHVRTKGAQWTADGAGVLFLSDHESPMEPQLYLADDAAPELAPVRVSGPVEAGGSINDAYLGGDPNHVIYFGQTTDTTPNEIYRARLDPPGEAHKLNAPLPDGSFLNSGAFDVSQDGARVVYVGYEVEGESDLFLVGFDGEQPTAAVNLTSSLPAGVNVGLRGRLAPSAAQVFFNSRSPDNSWGELYMVPLSPAIAPPVQISDGEGIYSYYILPPL